jgi:hypothetical protein
VQLTSVGKARQNGLTVWRCSDADNWVYMNTSQPYVLGSML